MKNFIAFCIFIAAASRVSIVFAGNNKTSLTKLLSEFQVMKNHLQKVTSDLTQVKQDNKYLQNKVDELNKEKDTLNRICEIKNQPCGDCLCVEDYSLKKRYFCNCRSRPVRRD